MKQLVDNIKLTYRGFKEIHSILSGLLMLIVVRSIFSSLSPFTTIYMSALIINGIEKQQSFEQLFILVLITIIVSLFITVALSILNHIIKMKMSEFNARYHINKNKKIMTMNYSTIENAQTHRLHQKLIEAENMTDGGIVGLIEAVQNLVQHFFTIIFSISLTISLFFTSSTMTNSFAKLISSPWVSCIIILIILINVVISMYSNSIMTKKMYLLMNETVEFNRIYGYYLENYLCNYHTGKDIRIYNQNNLIKSEYSSLLHTAHDLLGKLFKNQVKYSRLTTITTVVLTVTTYLYIGIKALLGMFSVGYIVQYIGSITQFSTGFTGFMTQIVKLKINNEVLKIYFEFMDIPNDMYMGNLALEKRSDCNYIIEFKDVSFKYADTDSYALKNVSLKLIVGQKIAIVGMNGSGKTTFIKLLCRLFDPTEGEIALNGIDIKKYDYNEYMKMFSVVFQDFKLFSFSLGQNVSADVDYDKEKAINSLCEAGFGERLYNMPKGIDTCLYKDFEQDGVEISGGEAQKIALARAIYKDAPFIVLDEPTSALDPIAEYEIYSKFNEIVGQKTAIYISHRLSSCRFCDDIAVFHEGELIQRGNHEILLSDENGKYYELWNSQAQYYNLNEAY